MPLGTFNLEDTENGVTIPRKWRQPTTGNTEIVNLAHTPLRRPNYVKSARKEFKQCFVGCDELNGRRNPSNNCVGCLYVLSK